MNCTVGFVSCFVSSLACVGSKAQGSRSASWNSEERTPPFIKYFD